MLRKQTALATLLLIMACRSEDSLIGDSNVYLDTEENTPPNGNNGTEDSTGSECIPGANLEVQSFQATPNTATDDENTNFDALLHTFLTSIAECFSRMSTSAYASRCTTATQ